ncbi:MAG: LicD family protein, partial [Clostridiaceae bacterium]|nr:LicD family protein [Clostridiaceae bacterium]
FIPWDDDLDIAIPIQDFDRFWGIAEKELPEFLKIYTCKNKRNYRYIFGKIHNINTTFIEESEVGYPDAYKGIFVDIMPIASVPDNPTEKKNFQKKISLYSKLNYIRRYPFKGMETFKKKIIWIMMRPFCLITNFDFFSEKWLNLLREYPLGSSSLTGYTWWASHFEKLTFPMEDFAGTLELSFEDTDIKCPVNYGDYLTRQFGDYMKLPPTDQRAPHMVNLIDTKESYELYVERKKL